MRGVGKDGKCDIWLRMAKDVWCGTRLKLPFFQDPPRDFIDIVWEIKERCIGVNWELFATTVWGLWNNRNQM